MNPDLMSRTKKAAAERAATEKARRTGHQLGGAEALHDLIQVERSKGMTIGYENADQGLENTRSATGITLTGPTQFLNKPKCCKPDKSEIGRRNTINRSGFGSKFFKISEFSEFGLTYGKKATLPIPLLDRQLQIDKYFSCDISVWYLWLYLEDKKMKYVRAKTSAVCGPYLQSFAEEEVVQTSAVCSKKTVETSIINNFNQLEKWNPNL
ncbi:hypothetical protein LXL04_011328 [Taraxacum kok-saghyz]